MLPHCWIIHRGRCCLCRELQARAWRQFTHFLLIISYSSLSLYIIFQAVCRGESLLFLSFLCTSSSRAPAPSLDIVYSYVPSVVVYRSLGMLLFVLCHFAPLAVLSLTTFHFFRSRSHRMLIACDLDTNTKSIFHCYIFGPPNRTHCHLLCHPYMYFDFNHDRDTSTYQNTSPSDWLCASDSMFCQ